MSIYEDQTKEMLTMGCIDGSAKASNDLISTTYLPTRYSRW